MTISEMVDQDYAKLREQVKRMYPAHLTYKGYFAEGFDAGFNAGYAKAMLKKNSVTDDPHDRGY